jgi:hypothetical protein
MEWMDVLLTFGANVSLVAIIMAIVSTVLTVICIIGLGNTSKEHEEIELFSAVKFLIPLTVFLWVLSAAPTVKEVKKVQEAKNYKEDPIKTEEITQLIEKYEKFKKENTK